VRSPTTVFKKKLYQCRPHEEPGQAIETQVSRKRIQSQPCDPLAIERGVRQLLADKVSGNLAGVWLLVAEHLRLGTWDLLCGWTRQTGERVEPRLAMQMVHEAAICTAGIRSERTLHARGGFELGSGLPFVATDTAIHELLDERSIADTMRLQVALGKIRRASGHFAGKLLAIDPHRVESHSRRAMRERVEKRGHKPTKQAQTFWVLDAETCQPVCFTTATAARSVVEATPELIDLAESILNPIDDPALILADSEHFASELIHDIHQRTGFDLLVPMPSQPAHRKRWKSIPEEQFRPRWAGFATAKVPYQIRYGKAGQYFEFVERTGERRQDWHYKGFLSTTDRDEVQALTGHFPQRWHVEEFFNANQTLGWKRAGTMNLHIRYGQMSMALIAQAAIHQIRQRLGKPFSNWDATHLAKDLFFRLEGDVRVTRDTIVVTYYNAPHTEQLRKCYENFPQLLQNDGISPEIPWLYNYKLNFRFR
jgi:Transposase DDE domain